MDANNSWEEYQTNFRKIFGIVNEVYKISNNITKYIEELDKMYKNLLNYKTNDKNLLYFGLNTFYFQIRFLNSQFDDSKRQFVFLLNHLYADYYKLYKLIKYHVESGSDKNLKQKINLDVKFPVYDDLSPYTQYKETDIVLLHDHIIKIVEIIDEENELFAKTNSINELKNSHQDGIPIANFIHGLTHEQYIMEEYIRLYKHYLEFFQNFYNDECISYKIKLSNLFNHIKEHAPLDSNPLLKKICKVENCTKKTYLNTDYCREHLDNMNYQQESEETKTEEEQSKTEEEQSKTEEQSKSEEEKSEETKDKEDTAAEAEAKSKKES